MAMEVRMETAAPGFISILWDNLHKKKIKKKIFLLYLIGMFHIPTSDHCLLSYCCEPLRTVCLCLLVIFWSGSCRKQKGFPLAFCYNNFLILFKYKPKYSIEVLSSWLTSSRTRIFGTLNFTVKEEKVQNNWKWLAKQLSELFNSGIKMI